MPPPDNKFVAKAKAILEANDRNGYTVPTHRLYPFQWNWDSAFVAMGFAQFDVDRAFRELERLVEGQWADGMIPHIVFHDLSGADSYYPGPAVWGTSHTVATSGITQPPVFAIALRAVHDAAAAVDSAAANARTLPLYEAALKWQRWWYAARDPENTGLVALLHPWESGSDNSPAWDIALARVPTTTIKPVVRKDTNHVAAAMRPHDQDYARFIHLVETYADVGWDPARQWATAPFKIAEIQTTAILLKAGEDLARFAADFGRASDAADLAALNARTRAALLAQWRPALNRFVSRDLVSGADVDASTHAGFVPVLALDLDAPVARAMVAEMARWSAGKLGGLPTTEPGTPIWEPKRYWRGPVWAVINWLLVDGLRRNAHAVFADQLREATLAVIETTAGFAEYFDPDTGEGCGGEDFSWTAAAYLCLRDADRGDGS
ncbi:glycogen debranching enzyme [Lasiosphaeria ovina]|uniref:Mannosyl-oligosaccharide glucosidase n=1 Tax=Lasiosphaeria ovina TaxID=92902 RepID=A0AAE0KBS7_9PEZI|nr:glycogen debranching enzyme [Lasiosphaeria ovina]